MAEKMQPSETPCKTPCQSLQKDKKSHKKWPEGGRLACDRVAKHQRMQRRSIPTTGDGLHSGSRTPLRPHIGASALGLTHPSSVLAPELLQRRCSVRPLLLLDPLAGAQFSQ